MLFPVFLAELGDKTMLATASASMSASPLLVLAVSVAAYLTANVIPAFLAGAVAGLLGSSLLMVKAVCGICFIVLGILVFRGEGGEEGRVSRSLFSYYLLITASELGDKTQLATVLVTLSCGDAVFALLFGAAGYFLANVFSVAAGKFVGSRLSPGLVRRVSGLLLVATGVLVLADVLFLTW